MKVLKVIPARVWRNKLSGQHVSIYGACPWASDAERDDWEMFQVGWSWENDNGTVGLGRKPAKHYEEAVEVMNRHNARRSSC